jgi:hypothetical protein
MRISNQSTKLVTLSQSEAQWLLALLDRVLAQADCKGNTLADVHERLSDSAWLSGWLRENVLLELNDVETIDLIEAMVIMLEEHTWSDQECSALAAIADRVSPGISMPVMTHRIRREQIVAAACTHG